jgi:hypothetical protein
MLVLLNKLGDPKALEEVQRAVTQKKDPQRRVWGMMLAAKMKSRASIPLIAEALNDENVVDEPINNGGDPDVPGASRAWRTVYSRVCDMAVRAIHTLAPPAEPWPFQVPPGTCWSLPLNPVKMYFPYTKTLSKGWQKVDEHETHEVVIRAIVAGFTDEQIEFVRRYVAGRLKEQAQPSPSAKPSDGALKGTAASP